MSIVSMNDKVKFISQVEPVGWEAILETVVSSIVALAEPLAWPVVVAFLVWKMRPIVEKLIGLISTIRYKGLELNLNQEVEQAANEAIRNLPQIDESSLDTTAFGSASEDPRWTIIKAWASVEAAIERLAATKYEDQRGVPGRRPPNITGVLRRLQSEGLIDPSLYGIINDMRATRNLIVHGQDIPANALYPDAVRVFSRAAAQIISAIESEVDSSESPS